jgi:hypothetical protein
MLLLTSVLLWVVPAAHAQTDVPDNLPTATAAPPVSMAGCDYVVQPGDTLWDIAQLRREDPYAYRSLWSINNQEVTNPHYIFPGQCLNFSPRLGTDVGLSEPDFMDPMPMTPFVAPVDTWTSLYGCEVPIPFSSTELTYPALAPVFIETTERAPLGELVAAREDKEALAQGDTVFLRLQNLQDVRCGDIYSLYVPQGPARHPMSRKTVLGYTYQVVGEVMIRKVDEQAATGEIITAWAPIDRNTLLTERVPVRATLRLREPDQELDGYIVGQLDRLAGSFFQDEVIFIDRGRSDNVMSGDRFWVVRRGDEFNEETVDDPTLPEYIVGKAVVFASGEFMSSAILVDQDRPLMVGDRILSHLEQ